MADIDDKAEASDGGVVESQPAVTTPDRKTYIVTDKAVRETDGDNLGSEGIFKNGKLYKPGDEIELDDKSAANYKALGEVEDK